MFELLNKKTVLETFPFDVEELGLNLNGKKIEHPYHRIKCPDWVNILPITTDNQAVLIRQPRAGAMKKILETPGGVIDNGEKDPMMAAVRELEEETGFVCQRVIPLASLNPNPAIQTNICHFFLGLSCSLALERKHFPDAEESIEVVLTDPNELDFLVRTGQINHSLSALTILLAKKYLEK
jgi:ADP-ribose pyrophosphatase